MKREHLADYVLSIPDFPEKGVIFRDITSLIQDPDGLKDSVDGLIRSLKDVDFDLVSGRYVIDAKSIMGIFSLDLSKPIDLNIHADEDKLDEIVNTLKPYIIEA